MVGFRFRLGLELFIGVRFMDLLSRSLSLDRSFDLDQGFLLNFALGNELADHLIG